MSSSNNRLSRKLPKYAAAVIAASEQGLKDGTVVKGRLSAVNIQHDGWCALLKGKGECNCNPIVKPARLLVKNPRSLTDVEPTN